jgi:hypothetical protein
MKETFTEQQREIVARKMGYDGPMQMFDEYLASTPSDATKYASITSKYVMKMAEGGLAQIDNPTSSPTGEDAIPVTPNATVLKPATTVITPGMAATTTQAGATKEIAATTIAPTEVKTVAAPTTVQKTNLAATTSQGAVQAELDKAKAVQGTVSTQGQATAATVDPTKTAVSNIKAAQGEAATVVAPTERTVQAGELVSGSAVDQAKVDAALAKNEAAQGTVTEEMTVSGQLNKLMTSFDAGSPPPWAASSLRSVTATLAARGLGASSLAGQALIQAALEAAVPIAKEDAKTYTEMGQINLSNRQAMALETAKQRATFLGQTFDQDFKAKALNAATISDIANKNFEASVTIALENSRLANSMNIANLSSKNALVLAEAAQIATLETANLNNRQQVAVDNAKSFLAMDLKNIDIASQTNIMKAQTIANTIVSDTSAQNAAKATNAANALEADRINASLALTASQYNASEQNRVLMANNLAVNEVSKFNGIEKNKREEFNATMSNQINIANAKILADISTANTKEVNVANAVNAKNVTDLSASTYSQQMQTYRDLLELSYKAGENDKDRLTQIATATITGVNLLLISIKIGIFKLCNRLKTISERLKLSWRKKSFPLRRNFLNLRAC